MSVRIAIFDRLLEVAVLLQHDLGSSLGALGLTTARAHLLWELHRLGPSTQRDLAATLKVSPRNVTGLVDAVEAAGFAERQPHPSDRRATLVVLTDRGRSTMTRMEQDHEKAAEQLCADLDTGQLQQLSRSLDTVAARLRQLVDAAAAVPARDG